MTELLKQRRFWAAVIPVAVMVGSAFGVPLTDDLLANTGDKLVASASAVLSLWSLFFPKQSS